MKAKAIAATICAFAAAGASAADAYIESEGIAGITTGYRLKPNSRVEVDFALTTTNQAAGARLFGADWNHTALGMSGSLYISGAENSLWAIHVGDGTTAKTLWPKDASGYISIDTNRHTVVLDYPGSPHGFVTGSVTNTVADPLKGNYANECSEPLVLFGRNDRDGYAEKCIKARIYGMKAYELNESTGEYELAANYVPCVNAMGLAGFADTVDGDALYTHWQGMSAYGDFMVFDYVSEELQPPYVATPEDNGAAYFDTGCHATENTRIELDYALLGERPENETWYLFQGLSQCSCYLSRTGMGFGVAGASGSVWVKRALAPESANIPGVRRTAVLDIPGNRCALMTDGFVVDELAIERTGAYSAKSTIKLASNAAGDAYFASVRIYGCRIYEAGTLVRDFVPCVADGVGMMYDRVSCEYSPCAGEVFAYGNGNGASDSYRLTSPYVEISAEWRQFFDTLYTPQPGTKCEVDYALTEKRESGTWYVFCGRNAPGYFGAYNNGKGFGYNNSVWTNGIAPPSVADATGIRRTAIVDNVANVGALVTAGVTNGWAYTVNNTGSAAEDNSIKIGCNNRATAEFASMRVFACRIWENGELVREFLPEANGAPVLYDAASKTRLPMFRLAPQLFLDSVNPAESTVWLDYDEPATFSVEAHDICGNQLAYSWELDGNPIDLPTTESQYTFVGASRKREFVLTCKVEDNDPPYNPIIRSVCWNVIVRSGGRNVTFCVDAAAGDDGNDGLSWEKPKASIQAAMDEAVSGDTILVKPGTYSPISDSSGTATYRIKSVEGRANTIIDGGNKARCVDLGARTNVVLRGFTLRGGMSDGCGGGAFGGTLEECDITGNRSLCNGGGVSESRAVRCRITDNVAHSSNYPDESAWGGGANKSTLVNCLVARNIADRVGGGADDSMLYNCTVVSNMAMVCSGDSDEDKRLSCGGWAGGNMFNTLFSGNMIVDENNHTARSDLNQYGISIRNAFCNGSSFFDSGCQFDGDFNCFVIDSDGDGCQMFADGDFHLAASSPCIDAGYVESVESDVDLDGNARIQGHEVDIGCYEFSAPTPAGPDQTTFAAQLAGTRHAIFVGVNRYAFGANPLPGCENDAKNMQAYCVRKGVWREADTRIFLSESATTNAVRSALAALAAKAVAGDTVLYYHSSHGGSVQDAQGRYTTDTFICMHDGYCWDYEMAEDLMKFRKGVKVVVILDTCHAAGMYKSIPLAMAPSGGPVAMSKSTAISASFASRVNELMRQRQNVGLLRKGADAGISADDIGWIASSDYDQSSWDSESGGLFTSGMLRGWNYGYADYDGDSCMNFYELFRYARGKADHSLIKATVGQCLNEDLLLSIVAGFAPAPDGASSTVATMAAPVPVEYGWLDRWPDLVSAFNYNYNLMACSPSPGSGGAGKRRPDGTVCYMWQDFLAGTDPEDDESLFKANIEMSGGTPSVTWSPDTPELRASRTYRIFGKESLSDADWTDVTGAIPADCRFFKITVDLK